MTAEREDRKKKTHNKRQQQACLWPLKIDSQRLRHLSVVTQTSKWKGLDWMECCPDPKPFLFPLNHPGKYIC